MMPMPLIIRAAGGYDMDEIDKLKEAEPAVNTMLFTSNEVEMPTFVCED
jgi:hypothetical protein